MTEVIRKQINDSGNSHQIKNKDNSSKQNVKNCQICLCLDNRQLQDIKCCCVCTKDSDYMIDFGEISNTDKISNLPN